MVWNREKEEEVEVDDAIFLHSSLQVPRNDKAKNKLQTISINLTFIFFNIKMNFSSHQTLWLAI